MAFNDYIRAHVTGFCHDDFSKIVTCTLNVERVKKEEYERKERRQGKKNPDQSSSYQHQSKKFRGPQGSNPPTAQGSAYATGSKTIMPAPSVASALGGSSRGLVSPFCTHCGRRHKRECWRLTDVCLACGSNEHKIKDYPRAHFLHITLDWGYSFSSTEEQQGQQECCITNYVETRDTDYRQTGCPCSG